MDDVGKLVLFHEVVNLGSFTAAARRRGLSHSTVSKHVRSLEEQLGVRLLHRTSRSMSLTDEGRLVVTVASRIGADVTALKEQLAAREDELRSTLRVAALVHVGRHLVRPAVRRLLADHPRLRVELALDDGPLEFTRGGFDVAVRVGLDAESALTARKVTNNHVCIVAAPHLVSRHPALKHPSQLADVPTVAYRAGRVDITSWRYRDDGDLHAVTVRPRFVVADGNSLLDAALDGLGVAYLSRFAAHGALEAGRLVELFPEFELPPYDPVFALTAPGRRPRRVEVFLEALSEVAAQSG